MNSTSITKVIGTNASPSDAATFIKRWFDSSDILVVSGKPVTGGGVHSRRLRASLFCQVLESPDGQAALESMCSSSEGKFDVYINMSPVGEEFASATGRGTRGQVSRVIGMVADLDVKPAGFASWDSILTFLRGLELVPTAIVQSGSGGAHVYWKFDESASGLTVEEGTTLTDMFWAWLNEQALAYGAGGIDRLLGVERMYRLPGSLRWSSTGVHTVGLFYSGSGTISVPSVRTLGAVPFRRRQEWRESVRQAERVRENRALSSQSVGTWQEVIQRAEAVEYIRALPWSWILSNAGWTWVGEDQEGRQEWARPGKPGAKSMTVDWPESPDVGSCFSTAEETGLVDLVEAGVVLSKERVCLRLIFGDDFDAMVSWAVGAINGVLPLSV